MQKKIDFPGVSLVHYPVCHREYSCKTQPVFSQYKIFNAGMHVYCELSEYVHSLKKYLWTAQNPTASNVKLK